jgi:hypothetical protein
MPGLSLADDGDNGWRSHESVLFEAYLRFVCVWIQHLPTCCQQVAKVSTVFMLEDHEPPRTEFAVIGHSKSGIQDAVQSFGIRTRFLKVHGFDRPSAADSFEGFRKRAVWIHGCFSGFKDKV